MSKRELSRLGGMADVEGSRPKRRRDTTTFAESSPEVDITMAESSEEVSQYYEGSSSTVGRMVKEQGYHLLQTVKEAKNKDGRSLAAVFLTKPPRKVYPDYYQIIQKPIALDDIKKRLDTNTYYSIHAVHSDFELLFNNALEYNMKDSVIWKDAKDMLKLVQKTYEKLAPYAEVDDASDEDEKKGKIKFPSLNRLIKSRLQKLIEKTDKDGRAMSTEFMQLPNRKQWAIYYKQIKNPQCLENIFRKIKRKEYHSSASFAADVERVFSNAMSFNQDHTIIWEDALALRNYFRELMSDLPAPHNLPEYPNKVVTNKIRIKPPVASTAQPDPATPKPETSSSTLFLRVPAASITTMKSSQPSVPSAAKTKPAASSAAPTATASAPSISATPASVVSAKQPIAPQPQRPAQQPLAPAIQPSKSTSATPQPAPAAQQTTFTYSHYSHPYQSAPPPAPAPSATPTLPTIKSTPTTSNSPAPPPIHPSHQIKFVKARIQPQGRLFWLDHREGVKTWAMRLAPGETGVHIDNLIFVGDEEGDESSDDEEEEEDGEEDDMEVDGSTSPTKNGKMRKGKVSVRRSQRTAAVTTRTTRSAVAKSKIQEKKKEVERVEETLLKLNGVVVKAKQDTTREWEISLPVGANLLEVGEKGGVMWKVHIERIAES